MPAREANGRYIYRSRDMKKKIAGIILQAARIYSKPFRQASGWRSAVGAYCKLNWCAVYILTVCMLLCTVCETFASSRTGTPVTPAASEAAGQGTELSDSEPELSEPKPENPKPEPSGPEGETREGWVKDGTKTYFFRDGKKQTGWQKIAGRYYYLDKKGILQKNKIAGDKKSGYYYVDSDGIRVTDSAVQAAVEFVMKHSDEKDSRRKRLKSCYNALAGYQYRRVGRDKPAAKKMKAYALEMFRNKKGDCYRFAAALACIARVLGYDSRTAFDNTVTLHGWTEIKTKGKWQTCDCSMRRVDKKNNFFLVDRKTYASLVKIKWGSTVRWDSIYTMHVKKGKVNWASKENFI